MIKKYSTLSIFILLLTLSIQSSVQAESLFRAGISHQVNQGFTPRSMFAFPRPSQVGDIVTVQVNESSRIKLDNNTNLGKKQELTENSSGIINTVLASIGLRGILPTLSGVKNDKKDTATANTQRNGEFSDNVTCQVVQVLPNGNLVIQGKKLLSTNGEQQVLYVSGIVNPFFLDGSNSITSQRVANLQMQVTGQGMLTRQQDEGRLGRLFRWLY